MGSKQSAPPPPDYTAAAQATAAGNLQAAQYTTQANRVNQYTPYGSLVYNQAPATLDQAAYDKAVAAYNAPGSGGTFSDMLGQLVKGKAPTQADFMTPSNQWTATQTLSPAQQKILDQSNQLNSGLLSTANTGLNSVNSLLANPTVDMSKLPQMDTSPLSTYDMANYKGVDMSQLPQSPINAGQTYQDAMMQQLNPQIDRRTNMLESQLTNQGITRGSQAWNDAMQQNDQATNNLLATATTTGMGMGLNAQNQAYTQAYGNVNQGLGAQQQSYNQALGARQQAQSAQGQAYTQANNNLMQPLNIINALRSGTQVQSPNFVNPAQQATTQGADLLGAAQQQYNAQLAGVNANNATSAGQLGAASGLAGAGILAASDRRLKKNIERIGTHPLGIGIYKYDFLWDEPDVGVMAQEVLEVKPECVVMHPMGYLMVDYARLGA